MNQFTIHITGTMDNDDGGVDVIDATHTGEYLFAICGTGTDVDGDKEEHDGVAALYGKWNQAELVAAFYNLMNAYDDPAVVTTAMLYAFKVWQEVRGIHIPYPEAQP